MASVLYVGHATTLIETRRRAPADRPAPPPARRPPEAARSRWARTLPPPDAVLLSHQHADHLDLPSLRRLGQSVSAARAPRRRLVPPSVRAFAHVVELSPGESTDVGELTIEAVPAVHDGRRYPYGKKVAAIGYSVTGSQTALLRRRHRRLRGDERARRRRRRADAGLRLGRNRRAGASRPRLGRPRLSVCSGPAWRSRFTGGRTPQCTGV